jgi:hypothetical protein
VHSADGPDIVMGDEFHSEPALRVSYAFSGACEHSRRRTLDPP